MSAIPATELFTASALENPCPRYTPLHVLPSLCVRRLHHFHLQLA